MNHEEVDVGHLVGNLRAGFTVRGRCVGGMQGGAWLLERGQGRAVLKVCRNASLAPRILKLKDVVARLRSFGYPTPAWLASGPTGDGSSYYIADFVPGIASTPLTAAKTRLLIETLESQAGLDPDPAHNWSDYVLRPDPAGVPAALADTYLGLMRAAGQVRLPRADLVHGDFNSCNIFLHDSAVSGVIDVEALGSGTRAVDYAWLLREAYVEDYGQEVIAMIRSAGERVAGPRVLAVCMAATVFDIVRFKLRHQPAQMGQVVARLQQLGDDLAHPA
jgi:aminoglycoside phosphotransferase (APT) family kinase protein